MNLSVFLVFLSPPQNPIISQEQPQHLRCNLYDELTSRICVTSNVTTLALPTAISWEDCYNELAPFCLYSELSDVTRGPRLLSDHSLPPFSSRALLKHHFLSEDFQDNLNMKLRLPQMPCPLPINTFLYSSFLDSYTLFTICLLIGIKSSRAGISVCFVDCLIPASRFNGPQEEANSIYKRRNDYH